MVDINEKNIKNAVKNDSLTSKSAEEFLEALAKGLEVPESRYEAAERSYHSVGDWLKRAESQLRGAKPDVSSQGSFALGTVNKPVSEDEDYDIDMLCVFQFDKSQITQQGLKIALKAELTEYAKARGLEEPESMRRCVRLNYAEDAQFHLDATPAIPDAKGQRLLLETKGLNNEWADSAVAITDEKHAEFKSLGASNWPHSNPKGYVKWFQSRMKTVFEARRTAVALQARAKVADIPNYRVKTPLQSAIQILKRHRDMTCDAENKPISIIITTLAAHAYNQEETIAGALYSILTKMEKFVERRFGQVWIVNPTDPLENFADKWAEFPEREHAFYEWLNKAKSDFASIARMDDREAMGEALAPVMGLRLVEGAVNTKPKASNGLSVMRSRWSLLNPAHKQAPPWREVGFGKVSIGRAHFLRNGFRWQEFSSGGPALPRGCELKFEASTNIQGPYEIYWQVVNTGTDAQKANGLRGGFDEGRVEQGKLVRKESTSYKGAHTIECFIIKGGLCVARSGPFIVNIQ